ncbi:MAG: Fic family protein [Bernardetiaceae bacterium]|nr:Fic family protein [Bernardetiaceae bacterium]
MKNNVYDFRLSIDWHLINLISQIDRFDSTWTAIEKRERQSLKQLKNIATVRSVGASTRIEGSRMSDKEIDTLLQNINISKLEDRDSQEAVGYFEVHDMISEAYNTILISENSIKSLHNMLMRYSQKDAWHKGEYKVHSNAVEATFPDGKKHIIFQTTTPGFATQEAMSSLVQWYNTEREVHALVKSAVFTYEFLSIHPFQDGNGRLSRLLSTLLLLKNGYEWIQYVSFEHEIEHRKKEYYKVLRNCQAQRPNEDITKWVFFFLDALKNIQKHLQNKLEKSGIESQLAPREKAIITIISNNPGSKSGDIAKKLAIPSPTVKRILTELLDKGLIEKFGNGRSTNYSLK